jgi:hypothetical protein
MPAQRASTTFAVCSLDTPWNHVHHLYPVAEVDGPFWRGRFSP